MLHQNQRATGKKKSDMKLNCEIVLAAQLCKERKCRHLTTIMIMIIVLMAIKVMMKMMRTINFLILTKYKCVTEKDYRDFS